MGYGSDFLNYFGFGGNDTSGVGPVANGSDYWGSLKPSYDNQGFNPYQNNNQNNNNQGFPWGNFLSSLGSAGLGAWSQYNTAQAGREDNQMTRDFNAEQAALNRQAQMEQLLAQVAAQKAAAEAQAGAMVEAASIAAKQRAIEAASQAALGAGQLGNNAFQNFITAAQRPMLR